MATKKGKSKETQTESKLRADLKIIQEARDRFKKCESWESTARSRFTDDIKFANADSENGYQWPDDIRKARETDSRPILTINKTRQYNLNITNEAKQNKPSIEVRPVGNRATVEGANVMEGIIRHIEYQSNAQDAYDHAGTTQVQGGIGYWRVVTDYMDSESFDQDAFVRPIKNPLSVYLDPDIQEKDGSDARFAFIYDDVPRDQFDEDYPSLKKLMGVNSVTGTEGWVEKDHVRVCEYYRVVARNFKLVAYTDPDTNQVTIAKDYDIPKPIREALLEDPTTRTRDAVEKTVEWFKICGDQVVERNTWIGSTIPIIRLIGEEFVIDGKMDRKGHTRNLKDPQRMYNYWSSSGVEFVALQSKSPYIAPARAIEGLETYWSTANTENHSVLPYKDIDDDGQPIAPPKRQDPPQMATAYVQGMTIASEEMRMAGGQYQDELGEKSQSKSGIAIFRRQKQGDLATYHFQDNKQIAVRYTGKILLEIIPKLYDTPRVIKIIGEDGTESEVKVDPQAAKEFESEKSQTKDKVSIIFNPGFAKYSVQADIGPSYATRREEAFQAFAQIMGNNVELMKVAGDLMFKAADFPMADELAERLKRMVPPYILGKGPTPEMQQLMGANKELMEALHKMMQEYADLQQKTKSEAGELDIKAFQAETQRLSALLGGLDPKQIASLTAQLVLETLGTTLPKTGAAPPKEEVAA